MATYEDFEKLDIKVGEIIDIQDFPEARKPSYKVKVNFGPEIGEKVSSVQATNYKKEELLGKQILAVCNFPPKNIAGFMSEILILGVEGEDGQLSLVIPSRKAKLGSKLY
ncbi:MAG: tRNA-binding protein [Candidatus Aenigmarchaeota archaeon]|nr:tRNA-binding protein [Candidatus Aenigmarchaeota archaeon]